ncbi:MAG: site-2 protease family protein [Pseudomonadota bacterium]
MASFVRSIVKFIALLVKVPIDMLLRRRRKSYTASVLVNAPRAKIFAILRAPEQTYDGLVPMHVEQSVEDAEAGIHKAVYTIGESALTARFIEREIEKDRLIVTEFLTEGSDPAIVPGRDYVITTSLEDEGPGTRMTTVFSIEHGTIMSRLAIPLGIRGNLERIARTCEAAAGQPSIAPPQNPIGNAVITGLVTLASFAILFGLEFAALLIVVLLLHELGHVAAMRWCGVPVRGIYFIPFMGAVAVGASGFGDEGRRGFIALLGPALSLGSTALFVVWRHPALTWRLATATCSGAISQSSASSSTSSTYSRFCRSMADRSSARFSHGPTSRRDGSCS